MEYKELINSFGDNIYGQEDILTDEIIREYIKNQDMEEKMKSDNFDIGQL
jgi:hypothetical protein